MNILLIDNHSKHREELIELLGKNAVVETQEQLGNFDTDLYDLIVLSGGSNTPSVLYNPEAYSKEISLVQNTQTPVLGICLGSEIITKSFGGSLKDLGGVHRGDVALTVVDTSLENCIGGKLLQVYEAHQVGIQDMPNDFLICAYSKHGTEIIKHKTKPIIGLQFHPEVEPHKQLMKWVLLNLNK